MKTAEDVLRKYWKFTGFRENQLPIIESVMAGKDTLALLTTGGGKSICFQVPAMLREGICLVISPLIALMKDQVSVLKSLNIPATALHSSQTKSIQDKIIQACLNQKVKFLYISPEKLSSSDFRPILRQLNFSMIVIDEAHCISQWGYDFRPSYLNIPSSYSAISSPQIVALTATATKKTIEDITQKLEMRMPSVHRQSFFKSNLSFQLIRTEQKVAKLIDWISKLNGSGLIYVNKRKTAVELSKILNDKGIKSAYYHAGLSIEERSERQEQWIKNPNSIMICTNAFGMGIDNPNTNYVIHYNMPTTLEAYFQESGRAGRQGQTSHAIVLVSLKDLLEFEEAISNYPSEKEIKSLLTLLFNHYDIPFEAGEGCRYEFHLEEFCEKYKLNPMKTSQGLQFLKENSLIYIADEFYKPDEIQIIVDEFSLNQFTETKPDYEVLIRNMIRTYEGLFYRRRINLHVLARNYHYNLTELKSMLRNLKKWEIIDYQEATNKPILEFKISKLPLDHIPFDQSFYRERKTVFIAQIEAVLSYMKNDKECKVRQLLAYFDENFERNCGICDSCLSNTSQRVMRDEDYFDLKDRILKVLQKDKFESMETLLAVCKPFEEVYVRRVLDRLLELDMISKGTGESFKSR